MTNAPESRKTHITRIAGTNRDGDRLDDIWADVERMDVTKSKFQIPPDIQGQDLQRKLKWCDNPDGEDYAPEGTPSRLTEVIKLCDPETQDVDDPDEWIPIRVIKGMRSRGGGSESMGQGFMDRFVSDALNGARVAVVRKVSHYDTNIDDQAQAAFDADPDRKEYVVAGEFYNKDQNTKDDSQAVEHEIVTYFKPKTNTLMVMGLDRQTKLLNQYLIDESDTPSGDVVGADGINPPYRLDPFQNIVNVKFRGPDRALVGVLTINSANVTSNPRTLVSEDGTDWVDSGYNGGSGASGLGYTVIGDDEFTLVAFGKPRNGPACFIAVKTDTGQVSRGTLDAFGVLSWEGIASLSGPSPTATSCSFAGGGFFISYNRGAPAGDLSTNLLVSFDGTAFASVTTFTDVVTVTNPDAVTTGPQPAPTAGAVTYDPVNKLYVLTGNYLRYYTAIEHVEAAPDAETFGVDTNFMSASSSNGLSWSARYDISEGFGADHLASESNIAFRGDGPASVCFGKGVFVAASSAKHPFGVVSGGLSYNDYVEACAVATSTGGTAWTNHRLPGSVAGHDVDNLKFGGDTQAVGFIKTGGKTEDGFDDGFFIAVGLEFTPLLAGGFDHTSKIWRSDDGFSWSVVRTSTNEFNWIVSAIKKKPGTIAFI